MQAAIGFLGLGNMGKHMATNLLAANHHLTLYDIDSKAYDHFKGQSKIVFLDLSIVNLNILEQVNIASNPENVVNQSDFIILMLPNGKIVRDICQSNIFP